MKITVPGYWARDVAVLDLETVKVPTGGFVMANGEPLRNRWSVAMAGIGLNGRITIVEYSGTEQARLSRIADLVTGATEVRYDATREFDEMICRGRFTNARRAHETEPFYPRVPGADDLPWRNIHRWEATAGLRNTRRGEDIASRDIPAALNSGSYSPYGMEPVLVHLLRDVCELILASYPDQACKKWCDDILRDYGWALSAILF
jgi:hypothetical protein